MKKIKNKVMLITYADSMGKTCFFPSSGDRRFASVDYTRVDEAFGG